MNTRFDVDFPYSIDGRARTAGVGYDDHIRDMVEQVLFTAPGERVNRPDFGCGLLRLVFEPNSDALAATLEFTIQGALQMWLGDLIELQSVQVEHEESTLRVTVSYRVRRTATNHTAVFAEAS